MKTDRPFNPISWVAAASRRFLDIAFYMPNRLSAAFRRKSAISPEDIPNTRPTSTEHSTFRVLERNPPPGGRGFDGGARMARTPANPATKHASHDSDSSWGDNMFAGLNTYGHR